MVKKYFFMSLALIAISCADQEASKTKKTKSVDVADVAVGGKSFLVKEALVIGKITVIDFWAEWCVPCKRIGHMLQNLAEQHSNLAVRRVEVPDFDSAVGRDHLKGVAMLPVVWIYDRNGRLVAKMVGATSKQVKKQVLWYLKIPVKKQT